MSEQDLDRNAAATPYKLQKAKDDFGCQACNAKRIATKGFADKVSKELQYEKVGGQYQIVRELVKK